VHVPRRPAGFELALVDVNGTKKVLGQLPPTVYAPRISPDGTRVAFETRDLKGADGPRLWTAELSNIDGRKALPLVVGAINWAPMWTLDGQRLVFIVSGERGDAVYWRARRWQRRGRAPDRHAGRRGMERRRFADALPDAQGDRWQS
jgi:Tol biopolymer transport system component